MTPSNANTSGLAEIAYARIENGQLLDLSRMSWGNYEPLVTAASAQARIAELEAVLAVISADKGILLDCAARNADRATAAEARADRLAQELEWYGEQSRLARLIHREGDAGRNAIAADGGKRWPATSDARPSTT